MRLAQTPQGFSFKKYTKNVKKTGPERRIAWKHNKKLKKLSHRFDSSANFALTKYIFDSNDSHEFCNLNNFCNNFNSTTLSF